MTHSPSPLQSLTSFYFPLFIIPKPFLPILGLLEAKGKGGRGKEEELQVGREERRERWIDREEIVKETRGKVFLRCMLLFFIFCLWSISTWFRRAIFSKNFGRNRFYDQFSHLLYVRECIVQVCTWEAKKNFLEMWRTILVTFLY